MKHDAALPGDSQPPVAAYPVLRATDVQGPLPRNVALVVLTASRRTGRGLDVGPAAECLPRLVNLAERLAIGVEGLLAVATRLAEHIVPEAADLVGTPFIAERLGCTTVWVSDMARNGVIPKACIVPGTGNGKPWKFHRRRIENWLDKR